MSRKRFSRPFLIFGGIISIATTAAVLLGISQLPLAETARNEPQAEETPFVQVESTLVAEGQSGATLVTPTPYIPAFVRVGNFSPDAGPVDVYLDGELRLSNLAPNGVGGSFRSERAGMVPMAIRLAGTSPDSTPLIQGDVYLTGWSANLVFVANTVANLQVGAYRIPTENIPEGFGRVQVLHAAAGNPRMHVKTGTNTIIARSVGYLEEPVFMDIPVGPQWLLAATDGAPALLILDQPTYDIQAGTVTTIIITGSPPQTVFITTTQ